jgi:hypothetical protein
MPQPVAKAQRLNNGFNRAYWKVQMNHPVRPIHIFITISVFFFNLTMSVAVFFKEITYLLSNQANYEYDLNLLIDELHQDLEKLQEE